LFAADDDERARCAADRERRPRALQRADESTKPLSSEAKGLDGALSVGSRGVSVGGCRTGALSESGGALPGTRHRHRIFCCPLDDQSDECRCGEQHRRDCTDGDEPGWGKPLTRRLFTVKGLFSMPAPGMQPA
jgi:hypothetical protein